MSSRVLRALPFALRSSLSRNESRNIRRLSSQLPSFVANSPEVKVTRLSNGVRVATEETHGETATVGVWIGAGSVFENDKNNGVAHFLEHMAFKGTKRRTQKGLEVEVENMGASLNAYTSREQTVYYAKTFKSDVPVAVDILSDILQNSTFSEESIERERNTILREMEEVENNTEEVVFDHLHAAAFQGTSLGRTILGPVENIKSITRQDLQDYVKTYYSGPRMVLAAAGGVKHDELVKLAEKAFGGLPSVDLVSDNYPVSFTGSETRIRNDDMPLAHVAIAVEGVGWSHPDYFTMMVIQTLIGAWDRTVGGGNNLASRLCEIVATEQLCHSLSSFHTCYQKTGLFGTYTVAPPDKLEDLVYEILNEWQRIANTVTPTEVERAKNKLKASILMQLDGTSHVCEDIGRQLLSIGRRLPASEVFLRINDVTANDVRRVAVDNLSDVSPAVAAVGPLGTFPDYNQIRSWTYWNRI